MSSYSPPPHSLKVLIIGSGGREHAMALALSKTPSVSEIHLAPGNAGTAEIALNHDFKWNETQKILDLCSRSAIDLVIIGPEDPLVAGLADTLRERGLLVFGPSRQAAMLEGSKVYAKNFMQKHHVLTAPSEIVQNRKQIEAVLSKFSPPYVLKADGLAAGKGVFICQNTEELFQAAKLLFEDKLFGASGEIALLEQFLPGHELSVLLLTNGSEYSILPIAQDHKRLLENDKGPNTGGMGTVAPVAISQDLLSKIKTRVIEPTLQGLQKDSLYFRGVLFIGLMIRDNEPYVLEYNCRFGDPETQVILPLVQNNLAEVFLETAKGNIPQIELRNIFATCVVLAAPGYPDLPRKGVWIDGNPLYETTSSYFIHAGTSRAHGEWHTNGGRVICAIGLGHNLKESQQNAYKQIDTIRFEGMQFRKDIGSKISTQG